jgi:hypothetical protein
VAETRTLEIELVADSSRVRQELQEVRADANRGATVPLRGPAGTLGGELPGGGALPGFSPAPPPASFAGLSGLGGGAVGLAGGVGSLTQQRLAESKAKLAHALLSAVEAELGLSGAGGGGGPPVATAAAAGGAFGPQGNPWASALGAQTVGTRGMPGSGYSGRGFMPPSPSGVGAWTSFLNPVSTAQPPPIPMGYRARQAWQQTRQAMVAPVPGGMGMFFNVAFGALELNQAVTALDTARLQSAFAANPTEAMDLQLAGIEQAGSGMFGGIGSLLRDWNDPRGNPLGKWGAALLGGGVMNAANMMGLEGPSGLRQDILTEKGRMAAQIQTRQLNLQRRAATGALSAFQGGGAPALAEAVAANQRDEELLALQEQISGLEAVLAGFGGPLTDAARTDKAHQLNALKAQTGTVSARFALGAAQRAQARAVTASTVAAQIAGFGDIGSGLTDAAVARNAILRQGQVGVAAAGGDATAAEQARQLTAAQLAAFDRQQAQQNSVLQAQMRAAVQVSQLQAANRPFDAAVAQVMGNLAVQAAGLPANDWRARQAAGIEASAAVRVLEAEQAREYFAARAVAAPASAALRFQLLRNPLEAGLAGLRAERAGALSNVRADDTTGAAGRINEDFDTKEKILQQGFTDQRRLQSVGLAFRGRVADLETSTNPQLDRNARRRLASAEGIYGSAVMEAAAAMAEGRGDDARSSLQLGRRNLESFRRSLTEAVSIEEVPNALRIGSAGTNNEAISKDISQKLERLIGLQERANELLSNQGLAP